jgi:hypothetical protein
MATCQRIVGGIVQRGCGQEVATKTETYNNDGHASHKTKRFQSLDVVAHDLRHISCVREAICHLQLTELMIFSNRTETSLVNLDSRISSTARSPWLDTK